LSKRRFHMTDTGGNRATAVSAGRLYRGWLVTGACFVMAYFAWGVVFYGHGFYIAQLGDRHGWSTSLVSTAVSVFYIVGVASAVVVGRVIDRFGSRWVACYGALATGLSVAALGRLDAPWQLFAAYVVMGSAYPALATAAISGSLVPWFERRLGLALGLALTGASVGGATVVPVMVVSSTTVGFSTTVAGIGLLVVVTVVPLVLLFVRRPRDAGETTAEKSATVAGEPVAPIGIIEFLKLPRFWKITLASSLALGAQVGFLTHQIPALAMPLDLPRAAYAVSITALAAVFGRFALGALSARFPLSVLAAGCYGLQAVGLMVIAESDGILLLYGASALAGFVVGAIVMLPPLLLSNAFGARSYSTAYGLTNACMFTFVGIATGAAGFMRDYSGSYAAALWLLAAMHVLGMAVILWPQGRR